MKAPHRINWHGALDRVLRVLNADGGIIQIRSSGDYAAGNTFIKIIKAEMERASNLTVMIDPENEETRTVRISWKD